MINDNKDNINLINFCYNDIVELYIIYIMYYIVKHICLLDISAIIFLNTLKKQ